MAHELEVWLFEGCVGALTLKRGRLNFRYRKEWLSRPDAFPLSHSLPLRSESFNEKQTRPFFAGLLPEGSLRRLIAQQFQVSSRNDFALLELLGGECAGAVSFRTAEQPLRPPISDDIQWLSDEELFAVLEELPQRPMLAGDEGLRLSLAGAQDKLPVVFEQGRIGLPKRGTPSSHILKTPIRAFEDTVSNEGFCLELADALELKPAKAKVHVVMGQSFLLVERYDRRVDSRGRRQRLHQEDFCQALGVIPELKYQNEGGPNLAQCFDLVRRVTRPSSPEILRLFDAVIFNALIGNNDAHAKNFSLLYLNQEPKFAPLYDVLSTAIYSGLTPKMAMKISGKYQFEEIQARHWDLFAENVGLNPSQARRRMLEMSQVLPIKARHLQNHPEHGFAGNDIITQIVKFIEKRCLVMEKRLTEQSFRAPSPSKPL